MDYQSIYITQDTATSTSYGVRQGNPLYNNSLNHLHTTKTTSFRNNFQAEWRPQDGLSIRGRISLFKSNDKTEIFKSPYHADYKDRIKTERGSYRKNTSDVFKYDGDVIVTHGRVFAEKHLLNAVGGWNFMSTKSIYDGFEVIGFPDDIIPNPAFSNQYPESTKASYNETVSRSTSFYLNANYGYDNRYLVDFSYRKDGSSVFGTNKRFTDTWAVGLAWNIHNEAFMGDWASLLKLRGSVGNPGNQNFAAYNSYTTYVYNTNAQNLFGIGANIAAFGNPDLKWQKTMHYTIGADVVLFNEKLRLTTDIFRKVTDPLIIYIDVEPSTGRTQFVTNLGVQKTQGITFSAVYYPIYKPADRLTWSVSFMGQHRKEKYDKIGNKLESLNNKHKDNSSFVRYYDGSSVSSIWAVRSAGIDPMSGREIYIKKDGSHTFDYKAEDIVKVGDALEKLGGTIGSNLFYKGFSVGVFLRYTWGADYFNRELYERIERIDINQVARYNQDKRALYDRWQKPGDVAKYRDIKNLQGNDKDKMSDRYLQRQHTITGESISMGYDFRNHTWIKSFY
ncbi:MAG: TonB-dependent receptor [Odoribacter sp.]|nr:TonB-dependent receptor [Odoribacter sp.]